MEPSTAHETKKARLPRIDLPDSGQSLVSYPVNSEWDEVILVSVPDFCNMMMIGPLKRRIRRSSICRPSALSFRAAPED